MLAVQWEKHVEKQAGTSLCLGLAQIVMDLRAVWFAPAALVGAFKPASIDKARLEGSGYHHAYPFTVLNGALDPMAQQPMLISTGGGGAGSSDGVGTSESLHVRPLSASTFKRARRGLGCHSVPPRPANTPQLAHRRCLELNGPDADAAALLGGKDMLCHALWPPLHVKPEEASGLETGITDIAIDGAELADVTKAEAAWRLRRGGCVRVREASHCNRPTWRDPTGTKQVSIL